MASVDKMEGAAVEAVGIGVVAILAYLAWMLFKGAGALPSLAGMMSAFQKWLYSLADLLTPKTGTYNPMPYDVKTGTSTGTGGASGSGNNTTSGTDDPYAETTNGEPIDYQIPLGV